MSERVSALDDRIGSDPENADLYMRRADLRRRSGQLDAARADYAKARSLAPEIPAADLGLGLVLAEIDPGHALFHLDAYLEARPGYVPALEARARVRRELGDLLGAIDDWNRVLAGEAPRPEPYLELADALMAFDERNVSRAIAALELGGKRLGQPIVLELRAIDIELRSGRRDAALDRIARIERGATRTESWAARRGRILEAAGRMPEARSAYEQALDAIETLPDGPRRSPAVVDLEEEVRAALDRLEIATGVGGVRVGRAPTLGSGS